MVLPLLIDTQGIDFIICYRVYLHPYDCTNCISTFYMYRNLALYSFIHFIQSLLKYKMRLHNYVKLIKCVTMRDYIVTN